MMYHFLRIHIPCSATRMQGALCVQPCGVVPKFRELRDASRGWSSAEKVSQVMKCLEGWTYNNMQWLMSTYNKVL